MSTNSLRPAAPSGKPPGLQFLSSLGVDPSALITKADGSVAPALANIVTVLQQAHAVRGTYVSGDYGGTGRIWRVRPLPADPGGAAGMPCHEMPQPSQGIYDDELAALQVWLERSMGVALAEKDVRRAVRLVALENRLLPDAIRTRLNAANVFHSGGNAFAARQAARDLEALWDEAGEAGGRDAGGLN